MRIDAQSKSKSLLGVTDLTLAARIRPGLIPALDSRTYESRLRLLFRTLNALRVSSLEVKPTPLIADAVDRIRAIHSFRLAIVGEEAPKRLLLSVAFDGGWEPYMRRIWHDLGPLLDVIFCNCEGYLDSYSHEFATYAGWVRSAQVDTEFFYNASPLTVNDLHYLRNKQRQALRVAGWHDAGRTELLEQALPALTALYRLTDMYPPLGDKDGDILRRAAGHLLGDRAECLINTDPQKGRNPTERAALCWFSTYQERPHPRPAKAQWNHDNVQGGIIKCYSSATHACLLLVALKDCAAACDLLAYLEPEIRRTAADRQGAANEVPFVNLGFTFQGLELAGVPKGTLDLLPFEFREGMAARASILGDLRYNHPINWCLPERNWPKQGEPDRVELSSVHVIVQYTCKGPSDGGQDFTSDKHPLWDVVTQFDRALSGKGVQILSVQCMRRFLRPGSEHPRGHFDFVDGISQPTLEKPQQQTSTYSDEVLPGDLLLGYENSHGDPPLTGKLWDDSTFLVLRKLDQNLRALKTALQGSEDAGRIMAKFMGRTGDGEILIEDNTIPDRKGNDFDYSKDPVGAACPFQSHIRRANPRSTRDNMRAGPRIMRRGMSYGPPFDGRNLDEKRGLFFMAYNASIAEQFEVIQAWLSGSNSSNQNTYSALRDPFLGVPLEGDPHTFVFHDARGRQKVVKLPPDRPIVKLEWGVYAFVPSIKAIDELLDIANTAAKIETAKGRDYSRKTDRRAAQLAVYAQTGAVVIAKLRRAEQLLGFDAAAERWKIALEDVSSRMSGVSQAVWAAIRELHGGALRTPYGVLVCSKALVNEVFQNPDRRYTVTGYAERMRSSFGEIYLGRDDNGLQASEYHAESCPANAAIMDVTIREAFDVALAHTQSSLQFLVASETEKRLEVKDIVDNILTGISKEWFGVPDDRFVLGGGWHWRPDNPPTCPGHFHSPSRYMFQPNPGPQATLVGQRHGKALRLAVRKLIYTQRRCPQNLGRLGNALFKAYYSDSDPEHLTSTLIGVMMGFLPTVDGNIRGTLYEWINDRSLWDYQLAFLADETEDPLKKACRVLMRPLKRTLLLRPVPELVWRTAIADHFLGPVEIHAGDRIVVSIVSGTQECLINDEHNLYLLFGGKRFGKGHPTHACPGYKIARGVMLGILAGLLGSTRLRPTLSPMELEVRLR
jgi:Dyp-type peroxidase family